MTKTAFFYDRPVVLDRYQHKSLRLRELDESFAAHAHAVPLLATEFPQAALEYPIVFSKGADGLWMALALTSLQAGFNAFVGEDGRWSARYVPASVRRYPFILVEKGNDQFSVAIDLAATHAGNGTKGEPLFDESGEPSALTRDAMQLLTDFRQRVQDTQTLIADMDEAGLLSPQTLQVELANGRQAAVDGVWIVDETTLRELPYEQVVAWFRAGLLQAMYAQMLSLRNLESLLERTPPAQALRLIKPAPFYATQH